MQNAINHKVNSKFHSSRFPRERRVEKQNVFKMVHHADCFIVTVWKYNSTLKFVYVQDQVFSQRCHSVGILSSNATKLLIFAGTECNSELTFVCISERSGVVFTRKKCHRKWKKDEFLQSELHKLVLLFVL